MAALTEEAFRELLDDRGIMRQDGGDPADSTTFASPDLGRSYAVFSQGAEVRLDMGAIKRQAERFFASRVGLTVEKRYGDIAPEMDVARIVIASGDGLASGTRLLFGRRTGAEDLAYAEETERTQGSAGLALLAKRCPTIWLIVPEADEDRPALSIAAVLASSMLGPIITPASSAAGSEIFGVRTARLKLEGQSSPYR